MSLIFSAWPTKSEQPQRIHPPPHIGRIGIQVLSAGEADGILGYERADFGVEVAVAVVAEAGFFVPVLALEAQWL